MIVNEDIIVKVQKKNLVSENIDTKDVHLLLLVHTISIWSNRTKDLHFLISVKERGKEYIKQTNEQ